MPQSVCLPHSSNEESEAGEERNRKLASSSHQPAGYQFCSLRYTGDVLEATSTQILLGCRGELINKVKRNPKETQQVLNILGLFLTPPGPPGPKRKSPIYVFPTQGFENCQLPRRINTSMFALPRSSHNAPAFPYSYLQKH